MSTISSFTILNSNSFHSLLSSTPSASSEFLFLYPSLSQKFPLCPHILSLTRRKSLTPVCRNSPEAEELSSPEDEDEWLQKLPDKKKPLYSHSLPCIEAWLRSLGFYQSKDDRAVWFVQKPDWHAQLSLDITDLYIRLVILGLSLF
ncbi:hypothetical protein L6164_007155 [Bauhinia variegata]|uniref:Uncharacterized protein n=1 Tax=Bauhinia variegata TaxID=167791 RepID=A0ACB9PYS0_BAUVA|nr:hypothetical protein L6164_007155 [Bauhinia variegata]